MRKMNGLAGWFGESLNRQDLVVFFVTRALQRTAHRGVLIFLQANRNLE